jgi:hypothetical protein
MEKGPGPHGSVSTNVYPSSLCLISLPYPQTSNLFSYLNTVMIIYMPRIFLFPQSQILKLKSQISIDKCSSLNVKNPKEERKYQEKKVK